MIGRNKNRQTDITGSSRESGEQIRGYLYAVIERELKKDESEIDYELIEECSDCDAYLTGSDVPLSEEEYQAAILKIKSLAKTGQETGNAAKKTRVHPRKRILLRILVAMLAVILLLGSSIVIILASQGETAYDFITAYIDKIKQMKAGDTLEYGNITLIKGEERATYSSLEEAVASLDMDILYPTYLPDGIRVERVSVTYFGEKSGNRIQFITNDRLTCQYGINDRVISPPDQFFNPETYEVGGVTYYIILSDEKYEATAVRNGFEYHIASTNHDTLIAIINGLKKIQK